MTTGSVERPKVGWHGIPGDPDARRWWDGTSFTHEARRTGDTWEVTHTATSRSTVRRVRSKRRRRITAIAGFAILGLWLVLVGPFIVSAITEALGLGPQYGYPGDVAKDLRIVQVVAETRTQPKLTSRAAIRDYLVESGVPCPGYRAFRQEPGELDFSGEDWLWAECDGGRLVLRYFSWHGSKVSHIDEEASCAPLDAADDPLWGVAPYKPIFWVEGPTWTVRLQRHAWADDALAEAEARDIARKTGARVYRSCAPSSAHPVTPVSTASIDEPIDLRDMGDPTTVRVASVAVEPIAGDPTHELWTVRLTSTGTEPGLLQTAIHQAGTESYWLEEWTDDDDAPKTYVVPTSVSRPVLRISTSFSVQPEPDEVVDVPLR